MTTDPGLDAHLGAAQGRNPVLAAEQLLADLAFVYYEAPNFARLGRHRRAARPGGRGARGVAPRYRVRRGGVGGTAGQSGGHPGHTRPAVRAGPGGGRPPTHHPPPRRGRRPPRARGRAAHGAASARATSPAPPPATAPGPRPSRTSATCSWGPSRGRSHRGAGSAAVAGFDAAVDHQLAQLTVRSDTIRLTAGTASIPITVVRNTAYPVTVVLRLTSDKLQFPQAGSQVPGALCQAPVVQSSAGRSTLLGAVRPQPHHQRRVRQHALAHLG